MIYWHTMVSPNVLTSYAVFMLMQLLIGIFQLITLETTLRLYWRDPRLQVDHLLSQDQNNSVRSPNSDYILLNPGISNFIWFPDIYIGETKDQLHQTNLKRIKNTHYLFQIPQDFAKALRIPTVIIRPASLRIYRNSTVRYATQWVVNQKNTIWISHK